eukprot:sb/3475118/
MKQKKKRAKMEEGEGEEDEDEENGLGNGSQILWVSKQPIRTRYLGHVTGYRPIRDQKLSTHSALIICGEDCKPFIEHCSENKIISYVGKNPNRDQPYVTVVTLTGGEGDCSIELKVTDRPERISMEHELK